MSDANGDLVGEVTRYAPFGGYRSSGPNPITDRAFTGQKEHMADLGLYYYNARYYAPGLKRFLSSDTLVPDPTSPQSLNRYTYGANSPLHYTDSTGHCIDGLSTPACLLLAGVFLTVAETGDSYGNLSLWVPLSYPRIDTINDTRAAPPASSNVTGWLVDQMTAASDSQVVTDMRGFWNGTLPEQFGALTAWTALVRTGAVWDFKPDIIKANVRFGDDLVTLGSHDLNYQAVANIFYGFVGRQIGMGENLLQLGAGLAQAEHGAGDWFDNLQDYPAGFGDQPFDAWSVGFGFYLYDLFGNDPSLLTDAAFADALNDYIADNPVPPIP